MSSIIFAILAAAAFAFLTIFHRLASPYINQVLGAIIVSITAVIFGLIVLFTQLKKIQFSINPKGVFFIILAGISAFFIDFLSLQAYSKGLSLTIGGPIIIGGSVAIAIIVGFLLGDTITALKVFGLVLLIVGAIILSVTH